MKSLLRIIPAILSVIACLTICTRSEAAPSVPAASIQVIAFGYNGPERTVKVTDPQGASVTEKPIGLPTNQCSPVIPVPGRDLVFTPLASEGTAQVAGKSATVHLPDTGSEFVLVFLPVPTERGGGYAIQAVELPSNLFKSGSFAFLNYTTGDIYCGVDKQKAIVGPAKAGILSPQDAEGIVITACFERDGTEWSNRPFFSGRLPVQKGVRNLVLVSRNIQSGQIEFRGIPDFVKK